MTYTVGGYLAARLSQIGLKHHFAVAGDFNLVLLDQLLTNKNLQQIYCSNELNCGYSAEGYARAQGAAAAVVTFSVGALSAFNAIAGAYAENLPVILVSGAPNTDDRATEHVLHHTLGTHDFLYQFFPSHPLSMRLTRSTTRSARRCAKGSRHILTSLATLPRLLVRRRGRSALSSMKSQATARRWKSRWRWRRSSCVESRSRCC